ncbi:XRE family transcriptional regulator [Helicobacter anatolicus]|uniref:XRE family transcriptional regulator n=1 Tax=Helicobacter anatolicus TaxID=2905874 RepID=UPI001E49FCB3|nr:XRE family transcriptional regulator [Helicobacter anatolicus]MCE3040487.1 XRE family transcriptional regulator [Helicobacter anatolicus]
MAEANIVKKTCKELGLTYKHLGELIGLSEGSIKRLATSNEVNTQVIKSCEMLLQIESLEHKLIKLETFKASLKSILE